MEISISIELVMGVNWPMWKQMVPMLEAMGFGTVYCSDHFSYGEPPASDALELITALSYLAAKSSKLDFGSLVAPLSVREPVMLARQAMSLNDLSGGRMILGVGSGWMEEEHRIFGYSLGDMKTRMDRFEEGLEVITRLLRTESPVSFAGHYFKLEGARLLPRPQQATRVLIGGKGLKRTLPLAARFADIWNCLPASPEQFKELSSHLDELLIAAGRHPSEVKRSILLPVLCYHTLEERHASFDRARMLPVISTLSDEDLLAWFDPTAFLQGSPSEIAQQVHAYAQSGVEGLVLQWFWVNDFLGLELLGKELLPLLT